MQQLSKEEVIDNFKKRISIVIDRVMKKVMDEDFVGVKLPLGYMVVNTTEGYKFLRNGVELSTLDDFKTFQRYLNKNYIEKLTKFFTKKTNKFLEELNKSGNEE